MKALLWTLLVVLAISGVVNTIWAGGGGAHKSVTDCIGDSLMAFGLCIWIVWILAKA